MVSVGVALVLLSALFNGSVSRTITVDEDGGYDNVSCVGNPALIFCKTLSYAVSQIVEKANVTIELQSEFITLDTVVHFNQWTNVTLKGQGKDITSIKCNYTTTHNESMGLVFNNSNGIQLQQLSITHCSVKISTNNNQKFSSGLVIKDTSHVTLYNISITNNDGFGAMLTNNMGNIIVNFSQFSNNSIKMDTHQIQGGGGMAIVVSQCSSDSKSCNYSNTNLTGNYIISNSIFHNNNHSRAANSDMWSFSYGGGLNIFLRWGANGNTFKITNSIFKNNTAVGGGGMGLSIRDTASNNMILIDEGCKYINNNAKQDNGGGGGIKISVYPIRKIENAQLPKNNGITIRNTTFKGNTALYGGGTSVFIAAVNKAVSDINNTLLFTNCTWIENKSPASTAVDIVPEVHEQIESNAIALPIFEDCNILHNHPGHVSGLDQTYFSGQGVFIISKIFVKFKGVNTFCYNSMTPLLILSSIVHIESNSIMTFKCNRGLKGGALKLHGFSMISYDNNITFNFINNTADIVGGAIYVSNEDPHYSFASHLCFFQNSSNSNNVFFNLINNHSPPPSNTIYVTSLHPCKYFCSKAAFPFAYNPFENSSCLGHFHFQNTDKLHYDVTTDASDIVLNSTSIIAIPGHSTFIPVEFHDDIGHNVTNVTHFTTNVSHRTAKLDPSSLISYNNHITLLGTPGSNGVLTIIPTGNSSCYTQLYFLLSSCPPGYVLVNNESCHCSALVNSVNDLYNGILSCDDRSMSVYITPGYWIGYINENGEDINEDNLYTGVCPFGYCKVQKTFRGQLVEIKNHVPLNKSALSQQICVNNRQGTLCGQCIPGTSVAFNSKSFQCIDHSKCHVGLYFYVLFELIPIVALFAIILYFNISFTNGAAYSIVFAVQHIEMLKITVHGSVHSKNSGYIEALKALYNIFNLEFFTSEHLSFCLWSGANSLDMLAFKFVSIVFAVSLIFLLVYCMNHCCMRYCQRRGSMVHGLTAFLIICYSQCTSIIVNILTKETLYSKGQNHYIGVVYLEGQMEYFGSDHIRSAILAVLFLCLIIIPVPLILSCDPVLLKLEDRFKMCQLWTRCREHFKPLLDSFQGCFKDNMRCFAGIFFLYRGLISIASLIYHEQIGYYYNLELALIVILVFQSIAQPFRKTSHNIIASLSICNLVLINFFTIRIVTLIDVKRDSSNIVCATEDIQIFLLTLPLLVGIIWIVKQVICYFIKRKCGNELSCNCCCYSADDGDDINVSLIYDRSSSQYQSIEIDGYH